MDQTQPSESSATPEDRRFRARDAIAAFAAAAAHGLYLQWAILFDAYEFDLGWRTAPHWVRAARNAFRPDDLLVRFAEFNSSPAENALYGFLSGFEQDLLWGKLAGIAFYAITACVIYLVGRALCGRFGGWVATAVFMFFPPSFEIFSGGLASGLSMPLLCLGLLCVHRQRWWAFVPLIALQCYVYPAVAIHTGGMLLVDAIAHDLRRVADPRLWRRKLLPLAIASAILAVAFAASSTVDHGFGRLADRVDVGGRIEFAAAVPAEPMPVPSLTESLRRHWNSPFHHLLVTVAFFCFGRRTFDFPRGLRSLFLASAALYWLSDLLLFHLYYPSRYTLRSLPLIMALVAACWLTGIRRRATSPVAALHPRLRLMGKTPVWAALALLLASVGWVSFRTEARPSADLHGEFRPYALYAVLRALPGRPMLAAPPGAASEFPILTGKSVLVAKEFSHPWWSDYWAMTVERTHDFFRAYYSADPAEVAALTRKHSIDYWLIDSEDFDEGRRMEGRTYMEPFDSWIEHSLRPEGVSVLATVPPQLKSWHDERYFLVAAVDLIDYIERRGATGEL